MRIHEKVRLYMKEKGIKQIVIAHKTGISPTTLNAILNGKRTMYAEDLKAICIALGVSAATFINSDENPVVS